MRSALASLLLITAACASSPEVVAPSATTATTEAVTTTVTATLELPLVVDDCTAPQVGFAPLCQVYRLVQKWHVDRPLDPDTLAQAALDGLRRFETDAVAPLPRTLFCAIPDPAFAPLCEELRARMEESGLPVEPAMEAALLAMGDQGLDPFSYYLPPDQVGSFRANGVVEGVGILLDATDPAGSKCARIGPTCPLEVVFVLDGNPGEAAGVEAGDLIVAVDGEPLDGSGFVETATRIGGGVTGTVVLTLDRDGIEVTVTVERAPLEVPTVEIGTPIAGTGYLRIPDFEADVPGLVGEGLSDLADRGVNRLVLDLRDNPGGLIDSLVEVAGELMAGPLMVASAQGETVVYEAEGAGTAAGMEVAVLVNGGTASAAEILALALRDQRRSQILGEPTYGKDALQIPFQLDNGGEFDVAVARWASPAGTTVAGTGITPDLAVSLPNTMSTDELASLAFQ